MFFITAIQASAVIELYKRENAKTIPNFYLKTYRNIVAQNKKLMKIISPSLYKKNHCRRIKKSLNSITEQDKTVLRRWSGVFM